MSFHGNNDLQLLCLKCISLNFERFFILFNSNVKESLLSCIKVVRKCYCDQLLRMLSESGKLKSEHLQFIINKYTREIDLQYLKNCSFCSIDERLEDVGSVITKFSMAGIQIFPDSDSFLGRLQNIQVLQLSNSNCTDRSVEIIAANCSQLKIIDVSGCKKVTDTGLTFVCEKNPPLESLNVEHTSVTYKSVALVLKNIPTLTKLFFMNVPSAILEAVGSKDFSKIKSSQSFNLENLVILNDLTKPASHLTAILKGCIKVCPFIKDLIVSEITTKEQLNLCSQFKHVHSLRLQFPTRQTPKLCANKFLQIRGENLTSLLLTSFSLSVEVLAKYCPNLEDLILRRPAFQETTHSNISFPRLSTLSVQYLQSQSEKPVSCIISSSPNLRELQFMFSVFSEEMQDTVLMCSKQLKILNFSDTLVTSTFIQDVLEEHTDLTTLTLHHAGISRAEFHQIMIEVNDKKSKTKVVWTDELNGDEYDVVHNSYKKRCLMIRIRRT